mgnify:FL=1
MEDKIESRLGDAIQTLQDLIGDGRAGTYDMAFLDADKRQYKAYFELMLELVRPGGLILVDNVLW